MADAQKTIDLIFNGIDKTGAATLSALDNAKKFTGSVENITAPIANFTLGAVKLEAGLLAAGAAMTVFAVKTAGDFDQSFRQISTLFEASDDDLKRFRQAILDYSSGSSKPLAEITASLSAAIGSGVEYSKSIELISTAEKLAVATRSDLKGTTEVLVSTLNAYGLKTEDAGKVSDLFFQIIKDGKIEMNDLAQSLAMVTPVAAASGVSLGEVGAAIATLTASGIKPATAIEYLRSTISNIIKPSKEAEKTAQELGISFDANTLKSKGLAFVLDEVAKATGGNTEKMSRLIGDVGGLTAALVLTGPQADKFKENITSMGNSTGAVGAAFAKMTGSVEEALGKISGAFNVLLVNIGTPLLDEFGGVANAIANIFKALGASVKEGGLKTLVDYVETLMKGLQASMEKVATNLPAALAKADFSGFKGGIDAVVAAFGKLFAGIDLSTVDGLTKAIELAGAAFLGLSKFTAGVIESFKPLFDKLVEIGGKVGGLDKDFFSIAGNIGGVATQINTLAGGIGGLLPWLETLVGLMVAKQGLSLFGGLKSLVTVLPEVVAAMSALGPAMAAAGVAMATYFASDKVIALVGALNQWKTANDHLKTSQTEGAALSVKAGIAVEDFASKTGFAVKTLDQAMKLIDSGQVVWNEATKSWEKAGVAVDSLKENFIKSERVYQSNAEKLEATGKAAKSLATAQAEVNTYALKTVPIFDAVTGAITGYEQQLVKSAGGTVKLGDASKTAGDSLKKVAEESEKAKEAQVKWNQEVAKMQFEGKLKLLDSQTKITTATIEANAKTMVAAFDSVGVSIKSTGDLLGNLFGTYKDFDKLDSTSRNNINAQIEKENKRREDAFAQQKKLIDAQVELAKAQTNALQKNEGIIKIDGAGLKPHLEAFMWEILQAIQVKVNKDGLKMLLGV